MQTQPCMKERGGTLKECLKAEEDREACTVSPSGNPLVCRVDGWGLGAVLWLLGEGRVLRLIA